MVYTSIKGSQERMCAVPLIIQTYNQYITLKETYTVKPYPTNLNRFMVLCKTKQNEMILCEMVLCETVLCET